MRTACNEINGPTHLYMPFNYPKYGEIRLKTTKDGERQAKTAKDVGTRNVQIKVRLHSAAGCTTGCTTGCSCTF